MTFIWGTNFSVVKPAFREIDPQAFNAVRMIIASTVFLAIMKIVAAVDEPSDIFSTPEPITRRDWIAIAGLGLVGHCFYQFFFIGGLALTTVANSSLMLAATPVVITILSATIGRERSGAAALGRRLHVAWAASTSSWDTACRSGRSRFAAT